MKTRILGTYGLKVSALGMGCAFQGVPLNEGLLGLSE